MVDFSNKKKKLLGLKKTIMHMPNNIQKVNVIDGYAQLLGYYREVCGLTNKEAKSYDIDKEFVSKYNKKLCAATQRKINEVSELAPYLYLKYNTLIREYQRNNFCSYEFDVYDKVNQNKMYDLVGEFFQVLGIDVCKLYNKIILNNNIFLINSDDYVGISMNALSIDNPCIILRNVENYLNYYYTLVHEMGHCYQFYLQRNHLHLESFNPFMEVTSLLFEKMFSMFLASKKIYDKSLFDVELENNIYFLNDLVSSKIICELMMKKDVRNIDIYDLSYESSVPLKELQRKMAMECGYIMANKLDFCLSEFHYSIGEIIASYFINQMQNDFTKTWKEYKNFICTVDNYPLKEILDKYMDIELIKENINTFVKSYRTR